MSHVYIHVYAHAHTKDKYIFKKVTFKKISEASQFHYRKHVRDTGEHKRGKLLLTVCYFFMCAPRSLVLEVGFRAWHMLTENIPLSYTLSPF